MNEPIPYKIRAEDIEEVLEAYAAPAEVREDARRHVLRRVLDIDERVRTAPENLADRREVALAEIEDILISDGFVEPAAQDSRVYPVLPED